MDSHTHSCHSFDGSAAVEDMLNAAQNAGVEAFAITDHCDLGIYLVEDWAERLAAARRDIDEVMRRSGGKTKIYYGVELGQQMHDRELAQKVLAAHQYDVVLGSVHNLRDTEDFYFLTDRSVDKRLLIERYFAEQLEMAKLGEFDVLAHLTYAYRYLGYGDDVPSPREFEPLLRELFTALAQRGKALEVNTSGLYSTNPHPAMPDLWELKLFKECGGEMVTLGSDAHLAENIGKKISDGQQLLKAAGFDYQAFFVGRKPTMHKL